MLNCSHHTIELTQDVVIAKTKDAVALTLHEGITPRVVGGIGVSSTVDLDDQFGVMAGKIGVVGPDRHLSAEMKANRLEAT